MSQYVHTKSSERHVLTWCYRRITTTFREELSVFREGEEKRLAQLVFLRVFTCPVRSQSALFRFRFEIAIANWKPEKIESDPTTNFWTVYEKISDEYDNGLASKYVGSLDNSLLFVSPFTSLVPLISSAMFCSYIRPVYSRP